MLSNSFVGAREREESAYGFASTCDTIVYSHEVGYAKPDRRIYELACARLEVSPAESVFVDDLEVNVAGALSVGMQAIKFASNRQAIAALEAVL
jgi:putative hydrolase of the HAD superfamily